MKQLLKVLFVIIAVALTASCAPVMQPPLAALDAGSGVAAGNQYEPKVSNFQVLLDASLSMDEGGQNDFLAARDIVRRINQGIPTDLSYNAGLRSIGHNSYQSKNPTDLLYGMTRYNRADFHAGLGKIKYTGGTTPMAEALNAAGNDLKSASGKSALIIVSDGLNMDAAPAAAKNLKSKLGDNLCIYTIAIGHENNGAGQDLMKTLADVGKCGFATTDAILADKGKMSAFIENALLAPKKATPKPAPKVMAPRDSDGDGVIDAQDQCPNTPAGELVDEKGCTLKLTLNINFDHDKADIKPEFKADLDRAAAYIKRYGKVPYVMVAGHTDRDGTVEYNQKLSEKRANAVRDYLIANYGIEGKRLFAKGFGKLQPVADNTTKDGRYKNRRVEIICCAIKPE